MKQQKAVSFLYRMGTRSWLFVPFTSLAATAAFACVEKVFPLLHRWVVLHAFS
jgi:hypothetical protein